MQHHAVVRLIALSIVLSIIPAALAHQAPPPGETEFTSNASTWFEREAVYTTLPVAAALLGLVAQLLWHYRLVVRDTARWSGHGTAGTFGALCGGPIFLGVGIIAAVAGLFAYIAFGSPASADEWPSHARNAFWSLGIASAILFLPWVATTVPWRQR